MLSVLSLLLFAHLAEANMWNGKAVLPHCQALNIELPEACRSQVPPDALALILPVADKIVKQEQVRQIQQFSRKRMVAELDTSIEARNVILECLSKSGDKNCDDRVKSLRAALEGSVKRLRIALALSNTPADDRDHSIATPIFYPPSLGAKSLPGLRPDELKFANDFQKSALAATERVGLAKLRQETGITLPEHELRERCRRMDPDFQAVCIRLEDIHRQSFMQFRSSMSKITDSLISRLPLALRFSSTPITNEQLKTELSFSRKTLQDWRDENAKPDPKKDRNFIATNLPFADEYVSQHPEACSAAEENILHSSRVGALTTVWKTGRNIVGMSTLCAVASPLVCFSVGSGIGAWGLASNYSELKTVRSRLSSSDRENPQASMATAHNKFRDFLVNVALTTWGTAMGVNGTFMGETGVSLHLMATNLEGESGSFFSQAGDVFQKVGTQMFEGLKGTAISTTVQQVADISTKDPSQTYSNWLGSDAFTARVYEVFETDFAYTPPK